MSAKRSPSKAAQLQDELAHQTFRIGPREFTGAVCAQCGAIANYMLARPYDLRPGGEMAEPACAEHAMRFPLWVSPAKKSRAVSP